MPEIALGFPRSWVEFTNPDDADEVFRCDLTWLTSRWKCIFGQGCPGVYADNADPACCAHGAYFADATDRKRVEKAVKKLTPETWQNFAVAKGATKNWTERDDEGDLKTLAVDGACIFHNRAGFDGGYGCALHVQAMRDGVEPLEYKPSVCWQVPVRRQFRNVDRGDGSEYTETSIGEYTRLAWGPGGEDFDWWCSSNTEAHVGTQPVYVTYAPELTELMGKRAYKELLRHCEAFEEANLPVPHPASLR